MNTGLSGTRSIGQPMLPVFWISPERHYGHNPNLAGLVEIDYSEGKHVRQVPPDIGINSAK